MVIISCAGMYLFMFDFINFNILYKLSFYKTFNTEIHTQKVENVHRKILKYYYFVPHFKIILFLHSLLNDDLTLSKQYSVYIQVSVI